MAGRCKTCTLRGLDIHAEENFSFCTSCRMQLAAGICAKCGFENGEMDDTCRHCSAAITDLDLDDDGSAPQPPGSAGRKLKAHASHGDAPQRKMINATSPRSSPQEQSQIGKEDEEEHKSSSDDLQLSQMMKILMHDMKEMKGKMATKEDVEQTATKDDVRLLKAGIEEAKATANEAKKTVSSIQKDVEALKETVLTKDDASSHIEAEVKKHLSQMKISPSAISQNNVVSDTVVFKGFAGELVQTVEEWIASKLRELHLPVSQVTYIKGDEFKGLMFARFAGPDEATKVVTTMGKATHTMGSKTIQCKAERPIEERVPMSLMLGLRWQLIQWGTYSKNEIKVDDTAAIMRIGRTAVVEASISQGRVKLDWSSEDWKKWRELQESPELHKLVTTANERMAK